MSKKLKKFLNDAEKTESKIAELEEYLRNVRAAQKKEEDNEIVRAIRSTKLGGRDLLALLENIQAGNVTFQTTVNHENKTSEEAEMEDVIAKDLKKLGVVIPSVVLTLLMAVGFSTPAFAYVEPEVRKSLCRSLRKRNPPRKRRFRSPLRATARWKITSRTIPVKVLHGQDQGRQHLFSGDRPGKEQRECVYALHDRRVRFAGVSDR